MRILLRDNSHFTCLLGCLILWISTHRFLRISTIPEGWQNPVYLDFSRSQAFRVSHLFGKIWRDGWLTPNWLNSQNTNWENGAAEVCLWISFSSYGIQFPVSHDNLTRMLLGCSEFCNSYPLKDEFAFIQQDRANVGLFKSTETVLGFSCTKAWVTALYGG